jgi:hypothetical protein
LGGTGAASATLDWGKSLTSHARIFIRPQVSVRRLGGLASFSEQLGCDSRHLKHAFFGDRPWLVLIRRPGCLSGPTVRVCTPRAGAMCTLNRAISPIHSRSSVHNPV